MQALSQDNREFAQWIDRHHNDFRAIPCCPVTMPACNAVDEPGTG
jgi:hypothetical protein